jgi:actin-related protein 8
MILQNSFPYKVINIWRRYDFLLAEELKTKYATMNDGDISVQAHEFHLRRPEKDTKKYSFRTYDEVMLAPMTHFKPSVLSHSHKLAGRQSLWPRSYDIYDNSPNDPVSSAQIATYTSLSSKPLEDPVSTPARPLAPFGAHLNLAETTPHSSVAGSPGLEGTPNPGFATPDVNAGGSVVGGPTTSSTATANANNPDARALQEYLELRDRIVPVVPLDQAVIDSIWHAAKGDEKRTRDFYASIMVVGGGSSVPGFNHILENRIRNAPSNKGKDIHVVIGMPPRELDTQVIAWKGASVFGKLRLTNDSWIRQREYDILGSRLLTHKCMWNF